MTRTVLFVKPKKWLAITMLLLGIVGPLFAGGAKEDPIDTAKQLIVQKQYDQAILVLSGIISSDPQRMDEAEALLSRVRSIKGDYNSLTQQFLDSIKNEPENYDAALAIIEKMRALDPNPNQQSKDRIEGYRRLAKLTRDRTAKNRLMAQALQRIEANDYLGAIDVYVSGFDLQREEFEGGTLPNALKQAVLTAVDQTKQQATVLRTEQGTLVPILQSFEQEASSGTNGLQQASTGFSDMAAEYLKALRQTQVVETAAANISQFREQAEETKPGDDANEYIRFIQEFMNGPPKKDNEGISAAGRALIESAYAGTLASMKENFESRARNIATTNASGSYQEVVRLLPELELAGELLIRAQGLRGNVDLGQNTSIARIIEGISENFRAPALVTQLNIDANRQLVIAATALITLDTIKKANTDQNLSLALSTFEALNKIKTDWAAESDAITQTKLVTPTDLSAGQQVFLSTLNKAQQGLVAYARDSFKAQSLVTIAQVQDAYTQQGSRVVGAAEQLQGIEAVENQQKGTYRYPDRALLTFKNIAQIVSDNIAKLDSLDRRIAGSQPELRDWSDMVPVKTSSADLRRKWIDLSTQITRLSDQAQKNMDASQAALAQAQQSVNQVKAAIDPGKLDLTAADSAFETARQQYNNALDLQYDGTRRTQVFASLDALSADVENARNALYTKQIGQLLSATETAFNKEDFNSAQENVTKAETLFKKTAIYKNDPDHAHDETIDYWKRRIEAQNNLTQERQLSEADPLYATVSNYLNLAQIDYANASKFMVAGNKTSGLELIARARNSISNVVLVKPSNWDAKILTLKLDQITDPVAFKAGLPKRVSEALDTAKKGASTETLLELEALLSVDPNNAQLKQARAKVRIDLGLDQNPVDAANKKRAADFLSQANRDAKSTDQTKLKQAITEAQQALAIDPTNREARALVETLGIRIKSPTEIMTFEDEQTYRRAESLLAGGDAGQALQLVNQLMQNSRYKLLDRLVALRSRIERALQ